MMKKILFALGGAGAAGAGGYYAKQLTGAAVGAVAGGVVGYLLARCDSGPMFTMVPGTVFPSIARGRSSSIDIASALQHPTCPAGYYWNWGRGQCAEYVK